MTMADKVDAPTSSSSTDAGSVPKDGTGPKAIIKNVDMSEEMQQQSVDIASAALEKYNIEKDIAAQIKKEFDRRHGPTWHVVVGKNFGSYVTHGTSSHIYIHTMRRSLALCRMRSLSLFNVCATRLNVALSLFCFTETKHFIYFYIGSLAILIWKS